jgi:hypothetical protein
MVPTIDEFGKRRGLDPYEITASVPGVSSQPYHVDVDMGPRLTFAEGAVLDGPMGASRPLALGLERFERFDKGGDNNFVPDPFDCFTSVRVANQMVHLTAHRLDGNDETTVGLIPTRGYPSDAPTDVGGTAMFSVTLGDVPGTVVVGGNIKKVHVVFPRAQGMTADFEDPSQLSSGLIARVQGPRLLVDLKDNESGIDLKTIVAMLNGTPFFNGAAPPGILKDFPDRLEVFVGDRALKTIDAALVRDGAFNQVGISYFPSRPKLMASGNMLTLGPFKDRAGNLTAAPAPMTFTWP